MTYRFVGGGRKVYREALAEATEEELLELFLGYLEIPEGLESVVDPEERKRCAALIAFFRRLSRKQQADFLAPHEALY